MSRKKKNTGRKDFVSGDNPRAQEFSKTSSVDALSGISVPAGSDDASEMTSAVSFPDADLETISGVTRVSAGEIGIAPDSGTRSPKEPEKVSGKQNGGGEPSGKDDAKAESPDGHNENTGAGGRKRSRKNSGTVGAFTGNEADEGRKDDGESASSAGSSGERSRAGKTSGRKKISPDPAERKFFLLTSCIIASALLWLTYKCIFPYIEDMWFSRFTEPALYQSNGHFTEYHLRRKVIPELLAERGISFPFRAGDGVVLKDVTAGPGSTLNMHFDLTPEFAESQNPDDVYMHMCRSRFIRERILTIVDSYRLIYTVDGRDFAELEIDGDSCSGIMYD